MRTVTCLLLDEHDRTLLERVRPLVPLAYPTAAEALGPPQLATVVEDHDPRRRVLARCTVPHRLIGYRQANLAVEVLTHIGTIVTVQADPGWWRSLVPAGRRREQDGVMAQVMAAERDGQVPRIEAAIWLMRRVLARLTEADDPRYWADRERGR